MEKSTFYLIVQYGISYLPTRTEVFAKHVRTAFAEKPAYAIQVPSEPEHCLYFTLLYITRNLMYMRLFASVKYPKKYHHRYKDVRPPIYWYVPK